MPNPNTKNEILKFREFIKGSKQIQYIIDAASAKTNPTETERAFEELEKYHISKLQEVETNTYKEIIPLLGRCIKVMKLTGYAQEVELAELDNILAQLKGETK